VNAREQPAVREVLRDLAHALQGAVVLTALLRRESHAAGETAQALEAAVHPAAGALRALQPLRGDER
jgi:hypothetical protein